jgi:hypothetical protein
MKKLFLVIMGGLLWGCASGPSEWAQRVVAESRCGMSVSEAEKLASTELRAMSGRTPRGTHVARQGLSAVWFDFADGRLVAVQPAWTSAMSKDDDGPRKDLCSG